MTAPQDTIELPQGYETTTDELLAGIDLSGRRALVTGVSAGLGVETARALAAHGANVVGTARDLGKARAALDAAAANRRGGRVASAFAEAPARSTEDGRGGIG